MFRKAFLPIAIAAIVALFAAEKSSAQYELVKVITDRQSFMFDMQTAYWVLLEVKTDKSTDLANAAQAAETINDAIDKFVQLLPPGTAQGDVPGSRAKPEIWTEPDEFSVAVNALKASTTSLLETARAGNIDAFKLQFDAMAQACTGCHDLWPSKGGKFRHPR